MLESTHGQLSLLERIDPPRHWLSQCVNASALLHLACVMPDQVEYASRQCQTAERLMPGSYTLHRLAQDLGRRGAPESGLMGPLCLLILRRRDLYSE